MHASPANAYGNRVLHSTAYVPGTPATMLRDACAFLRMKCGSLEDAFRFLDNSNAGTLTVESFVLGLEKLGYESPLAETTRVFQAMDSSATGRLGLSAFLMAFGEDSDHLNVSTASATAKVGLEASLSMQTTKALSPLPHGTDSAGGGTSSTVASSERGLRDTDVANTKKFLQELVEEKMVSVMSRIEGRLEAEMYRFRGLVAAAENNAKTEAGRVAQIAAQSLAESQCIDACVAAIAPLQQRIDVVEHLIAQHQNELRNAITKMDESNAEAKSLLLMVQNRAELTQNTVNRALQGLCNEVRGRMEEEGKKNETPQQVIRAESQSRSESSTRVPVTEATLKSLNASEASMTNTASIKSDTRERKASVQGVAAVPEHIVENGKLEAMLHSILEKLDNKCLDGVASDMKELTTLLSAAPGTPGTNVRESDHQKTPSQGDVESERSFSDVSAKGVEMQKLREDILGYLRSDFQQLVSQTLTRGASQDTNTVQRGSIDVQRQPSVDLQRQTSPEKVRRELSRPVVLNQRQPLGTLAGSTTLGQSRDPQGISLNRDPWRGAQSPQPQQGARSPSLGTKSVQSTSTIPKRQDRHDSRRPTSPRGSIERSAKDLDNSQNVKISPGATYSTALSPTTAKAGQASAASMQQGSVNAPFTRNGALQQLLTELAPHNAPTGSGSMHLQSRLNSRPGGHG